MKWYLLFAIIGFVVPCIFFIRRTKSVLFQKGFTAIDYFILLTSVLLIGYLGSFLSTFLPELIIHGRVRFDLSFKLYGAFLLYLVLFGMVLSANSSKRSYLLFIADNFALTFCIALILGKTGCFLEAHRGCSGVATDLPWGITYSFSDSPFSTPVHPAQIYHIIFNLVMFVVLSFVDCKKKNAGKIFRIYIIAFSLFSLLMVEIMPETYTSGHFSAGQMVYFISFLLGLGLPVVNHQALVEAGRVEGKGNS